MYSNISISHINIQNLSKTNFLKALTLHKKYISSTSSCIAAKNYENYYSGSRRSSEEGSKPLQALQR